MTTINTLSPQNSINKNTSVDKKQRYSDPLNSWNLKWMSYTNEVGTAISEIAPKMGAMLWIPSFMYIGADVYDKYKNDKDKFNPSSKRAFERAVYQGMTNLIALPFVISLGQKMVSPLPIISGEKVSVNKKDAVFKHINQLLQQGIGDEINDKESFKKLVRTTFENKITAKKSEYKKDNIFKKIFKFYNDEYTIAFGDKQQLLDYVEYQGEEFFEVRKQLLKGSSSNLSRAVVNEYKTNLGLMKETHGYDYGNHALRSALIKFGNEHIFSNKIVKTLGGFSTLFLLGPIVSKYVEKKLVGTYVDNGLNFAYNNVVKNSNIKNIFNNLGDKDSKSA